MLNILIRYSKSSIYITTSFLGHMLDDTSDILPI